MPAATTLAEVHLLGCPLFREPDSTQRLVRFFQFVGKIFFIVILTQRFVYPNNRYFSFFYFFCHIHFYSFFLSVLRLRWERRKIRGVETAPPKALLEAASGTICQTGISNYPDRVYLLIVDKTTSGSRVGTNIDDVLFIIMQLSGQLFYIFKPDLVADTVSRR